jgi:hemoglobin
MSIYEELGGRSGLTCAVADFYHRLLADPEVSSFFDPENGVDPERLKGHVAGFLAAVLGGPDEYTGRGLMGVHAELGITDTDFDAFIAHFVDTLNSAGTSDETVGEVGKVIAGLRSAIVTVHHHRPAPAAVVRSQQLNPQPGDTPV